MVIFNCIKCSKIFNNPVECTNCHNFFCKEHLKKNSKCPICEKKSNYIENNWFIKEWKKYKNEENRKKQLLKKCYLCGFEGENDSFWVHLIEKHKNQIINYYSLTKFNTPKTIQTDDMYEDFKVIRNSSKFKKKNKIDDLNNSNTNENKNKLLTNCNNIKLEKFKEESNNNNLVSNLEHIKNNNKNKICKYRYKSEEKRQRRNKIKFFKNFQKYNLYTEKYFQCSLNNSSSEEIIKYYCERKNKIIKCDCCPDHICRKGNCFCVNCMQINIRINNLKNGELITKSGRIATFENGEYHCGKKQEIMFFNFIGQEIVTNYKCKYPLPPCPDCKILIKYMKYYLPKDIYYRIKNK